MSTSRVLKNIAFTAAAQDHHTSIKVKNVLRWLKSGYEVKVNINGKADRQKSMESIYKQLESRAKSGAEIKQKIVKPDSIKFYMKPTLDAPNIVVDESGINEVEPEEIDDITLGKDILSDEFEKELEQSLKSERDKTKRR